MKLILEKREISRGLLGGKTVFVLTARAETTEEESKAILHYRLSSVVFYQSDAEERGPRQYFGGSSSLNLAERILFKQSTISITGSNLTSGMTFENESLLHLMDLEDRIKQAAHIFSEVVARSLKFMGEETFDLPLV